MSQATRKALAASFRKLLWPGPENEREQGYARLPSCRLTGVCIEAACRAGLPGSTEVVVGHSHPEIAGSVSLGAHDQVR